MLSSIAKLLLWKILMCSIFCGVEIIGKQAYRETITFAENPLGWKLSSGGRGHERINLSVPGDIFDFRYYEQLNILVFTFVSGTKWCGPGNTASNYNDLGHQEEVDMCCRDHDHCDNIPGGETKYNLTNTDYFTVLHCDCDKAFYKCLHQIDSKMSNHIGKMYFTLRNRCYRNDFPIVECAEYDTAVFVRRCMRYILDESQQIRYQWFDLPLYYKKSNSEQMHDFYDIENTI